MLRSFIILLPCFSCLFWSIALACSWKTNSRQKNYWMAGSLILATCIYIWSIHFADVYNYKILFKLDKVEGIPVLLLLPILYFCFKSSTDEQPFSWKDSLWLLPSLLVVGSMILSYSIMGKDLAIEYIRDVIQHKDTRISFTDPLHQRHYLISGPVYGMLVLIQIAYLLTSVTTHLIRHSNWNNNNYHHTRNKSIKYQYSLSIGIYIALFLSLATYQGRSSTITNPALFQLLLGIWIIALYYIRLHINRVDTTPTLVSQSQRAIPEITRQKYPANENRKTGSRIKLLLHLNRLIDEEQIFLQHDLRLEDLARTMRTNRTYISRLINNEFHCSFSGLINSKRIEHAQKLMQANQEMTQEQIAECSGFQRANTFGRAFKQQAGITFREWQNSNTHCCHAPCINQKRQPQPHQTARNRIDLQTGELGKP